MEMDILNKSRSKFLCLGLLFFHSCTFSTSHQVTPAFYHWQSELNITNYEAAVLDSLNVHHLYLRFFDLDWNSSQNEVVPVGQLQIDQSIPTGIQIIPTIFITNRTFKNLKEEKLPELVEKVARKLREQIAELNVEGITEIQLDCDWTRQTRAIYFGFVELVRKEFSEMLVSTTIRLHQIKYPEETGIPPTEQGMLMFYNTGKLEDPDTKNSILDWTTASKYLDRLSEYPMELDLALPIFSWGVLFRDGKMIKLINNLPPESLADSTRFKFINEGSIEVLKSTYLQGYYLYAGDRIRLEGVSPETLIFVADQLKDKIASESLRLTYYHLDSATIKKYSYAHFQQIKRALEN